MFTRLFRWLTKPRYPYYVSEIDKFLQTLRNKQPRSASQEAEIHKHQVIAAKRDGRIMHDAK